MKITEKINTASCFLSPDERERILAGGEDICLFLDELRIRVSGTIRHPGLPVPSDGTRWWYFVFECLSEASMLYAVEHDDRVGEWLRNTTLSIIRLPVGEWAGPWFRDHSQPYSGHLETAHVCWAVAAVLDLASPAFELTELEEIKTALIEKGVILCERWLAKNIHLANWRGIMLAGVMVPAVVLGDEQRIAKYLPLMDQCLDAFQQDGSYAESLQYGNYLANALMLVFESLIRAFPDSTRRFKSEVYARGMHWVTQSMLYTKPLSGWDSAPRARAVNFNDSAAIFRPSGDLLLHIASRFWHSDPNNAGLARYLFSKYYQPFVAQEPHHLASFGFINDWGFLTLPLLAQACEAMSPETCSLPLTVGFENGNVFIRDSWQGKTVIAIQGGAMPLHGPGHLHGDVNSFMVVHNTERLLADPGHSCYRNLIHGLESSSQTHNTCTFLVEDTGLGLQEDLTKTRLLEQNSVIGKRLIRKGTVEDPVIRGNVPLILERIKGISVAGSEASRLYGDPVKEFSRFWISCGSHTLFVVDRIAADRPIRTCWNWVVNNRDGLTQTSIENRELKIQRPLAGLKLYQGGGAALLGPVYGYMHDAYHPEPARNGEGRPGSGLIYRAISTEAKDHYCAVNMLIFDEPENLDNWQFRTEDNEYGIVGDEQRWTLRLISERPLKLIVFSSDDQWSLIECEGKFQIK